MADSTRVFGTSVIGLTPEEASRLAPGIIDAKNTAPSGKDSSFGKVNITYGEPNAAPRGDESRRARAEYRERTRGGDSFQHGNASSDLNKFTGGRANQKPASASAAHPKASPPGDEQDQRGSLPRDVKDYGK